MEKLRDDLPQLNPDKNGLPFANRKEQIEFWDKKNIYPSMDNPHQALKEFDENFYYVTLKNKR